MSLDRFRRIVVVAGVFLALIIFTGAAVRLTESGLGCEDWPTCSEDQVVPEWSFHEWVEFGNRLVSGPVLLAVLYAAYSARHLEVGRRRDLERWSLGIVAMVGVQVVVGRFTVIADLLPTFVAIHFLLSIVTIWQVSMLWHLATFEDAGARPCTPDPSIRTHSRLTVALAGVVIVLGTLVTGTGPHGGDSRADRMSFDLEAIARIHSLSVWVFLAAVVALAIRLARSGLLMRPIQRVVAVAVAQGAVGYIQFAAGVPAWLVEIHVIGSVALWFVVLRQNFSLVEAPPVPPPADAPERSAIRQT